MIFEQDEIYYGVIDFTAVAQYDNYNVFVNTQFSVFPCSSVSSTLEEAYSSMVTEEITGEAKIINVKFKGPEKKEKKGKDNS